MLHGGPGRPETLNRFHRSLVYGPEGGKRVEDQSIGFCVFGDFGSGIGGGADGAAR